MKNLGKVFKEPLLHFLALGAILFIASTYRDAPAVGQRDEIVVSPGVIDSLRTQWEGTWQRPPDAEELDRLIEDHVREEIFYREAIRMGLAEDDTIVRRRLRQKMEFLAEEFVRSEAPNEAALRAHFESNAEQYRLDDRFTFRQVYFNADSDPDSARKAIDAVRAQLANGAVDFDDVVRRGALPSAMRDASARDIRAQFGALFVDELWGVD